MIKTEQVSSGSSFWRGVLYSSPRRKQKYEDLNVPSSTFLSPFDLEGQFFLLEDCRNKVMFCCCANIHIHLNILFVQLVGASNVSG